MKGALHGDNGPEGNPGYFIPNNREGRRKIALRGKRLKRFLDSFYEKGIATYYNVSVGRRHVGREVGEEMYRIAKGE